MCENRCSQCRQTVSTGDCPEVGEKVYCDECCRTFFSQVQHNTSSNSSPFVLAFYNIGIFSFATTTTSGRMDHHHRSDRLATDSGAAPFAKGGFDRGPVLGSRTCICAISSTVKSAVSSGRLMVGRPLLLPLLRGCSSHYMIYFQATTVLWPH